ARRPGLRAGEPRHGRWGEPARCGDRDRRGPRPARSAALRGPAHPRRRARRTGGRRHPPERRGGLSTVLFPGPGARRRHSVAARPVARNETPMKLTIDTDARTLSVATDAAPRVLPLYGKEAFELLSEQWLKVGWNQKYPYTFSWMGRPIIQ